MFFDTLGFESYFVRTDGVADELLVIPDGRTDFLAQVRDYVESYGFVPYHYCFSIERDGYIEEGDKVRFVGALSSMVEFQSVSGRFTLLLFESEQGFFIWKTYSEITSPPKSGLVTGRMKAVIKSKEGRVVNLISHCRIK